MATRLLLVNLLTSLDKHYLSSEFSYHHGLESCIVVYTTIHLYKYRSLQPRHSGDNLLS